MNKIQQAIEQGRALGFLTDETSAEWFKMTVLQLLDGVDLPLNQPE